MKEWNGIEIYGYDYKRMIAYLKTLDKEYLDNLQQCNAAKGYCEFLWKDINKKHIPNNESIDIPPCEQWPYGDYWGSSSDFIQKRIINKYKFEISDDNLKAIKFDIVLSELKGQSLHNAIDYWCLANNVKVDLDDERILLKLIELKLLLLKTMS